MNVALCVINNVLCVMNVALCVINDVLCVINVVLCVINAVCGKCCVMLQCVGNGVACDALTYTVLCCCEW